MPEPTPQEQPQEQPQPIAPPQSSTGEDLIFVDIPYDDRRKIDQATIRTFTKFPLTPSSAPTTDYEVPNKKYVDDNVTPFYLGIFGDGSDGNKVVTGIESLTDEMYYNNLTIQSGGQLDTAQYRVFVRGTLTIDAGGVILCIGNNGSGVNGGHGLTEKYFGDNLDAGDGGYGDANGGNGQNVITSYGGVGGTGGNSGVYTGGTGGTITAPIKYDFRNVPDCIQLLDINPGVTPTIRKLRGGSGGGGGGANNGIAGGGGGGGGVILISAKTIINNQSTGIAASGGSGANGAGTNSGGGGGGGGGVMFLVYHSYSGTGTLSVYGGNGGTGVGTGANGANGVVGTIFQIQV